MKQISLWAGYFSKNNGYQLVSKISSFFSNVLHSIRSKTIALAIILTSTMSFSVQSISAEITFNAFEGATLVDGVFTFPTSGQAWAGFSNANADVYPITVAEDSVVTFNASVPDGSSADVRFRFEANPHPYTEPSFNTAAVTVSGSEVASYSVAVPSQGDLTFNSFLLFLDTRDVGVVVTDVVIAGATGGAVPAVETSAYCGTEVTHFNIPGHPGSILLSVENSGADSMTVTATSANDVIDLLILESIQGGGTATTTIANGVATSEITWAAGTMPATTSFIMLWSDEASAGNLMLEAGDGYYGLGIIDTAYDCADYYKQTISVLGEPNALIGHTTSLDIVYDNGSNNYQLPGLGFRIHYNSEYLSFNQMLINIEQDLVVEEGPFVDDQDFDDNPTTDRFLTLGWASVNGNWPNVILPANLLSVQFDVLDAIETETATTTQITFSKISVSTGYEFEAINYEMDVLAATWDFDGNGKVDALTDGLIFLRYTFGLRGEILTRDVVATDSTYSSSQIEEKVIKALSIGDIDNSGEIDALTDGLMLLRYMFGLRDEALTSKILAYGAERSAAAEIEQYINKFIPRQVSPNNKLNIFSDSDNYLEGTDFDPHWGQATDAIVGDEYVLNNLNYQGVAFSGAIDVSGYEFLHLDYYTDDSTALNVFLISSGPSETAYALDVSATGQWNSVDIPLNSFSAVNLADVILMMFDGNGTIRLDNIYFGGRAPAPSTAIELTAGIDGVTIVDGVYTFPTYAQPWAFFYAENDDIYPITVASDSVITFTGSVPSGGDVDVRFTFEANPFPHNMPNYSTGAVTVSGSEVASYSVAVPSQGNLTFNSFLMNLDTRDVGVVVTDVVIAGDTGGADPVIETTAYCGTEVTHFNLDGYPSSILLSIENSGADSMTVTATSVSDVIDVLLVQSIEGGGIATTIDTGWSQSIVNGVATSEITWAAGTMPATTSFVILWSDEASAGNMMLEAGDGDYGLGIIDTASTCW